MSFWSDPQVLHGITVRPHFFDAGAMQRHPDLVTRALPFFAESKTKPVALHTESDRKNFVVGQLIAQPDVVFAHGSGYISEEYKSVGFRNHDSRKWGEAIRLKDMLQCLLAGYAVAQNRQRPTACVLRYHNVCYLLTPRDEVVIALLDLIPMAMLYYQESRRVSASQLAQFGVEKIQKQFPRPQTERSRKGIEAHEMMLRR